MRSNSPLDLAVARGHCCPNKCLWFRIPGSRCSGRRADRSAVQSVSIHAPHAGRHQVGQTVTLTQSKSRPPISHTPNCSSMWTASKQHTTPCSIPNRHTIPFGASIPNCYPRHPRRPTASTVCKKPDLPLRCHAVAMVLATPPHRRISQAILEQEKTPEKFQEPSLAGVHFGSSPNSSRSSGFDRKPSRSCSMASFASGSELNFCIMQ